MIKYELFFLNNVWVCLMLDIMKFLIECLISIEYFYIMIYLVLWYMYFKFNYNKIVEFLIILGICK